MRFPILIPALLLALALCVPVRAARHGQTLTGVSDGGGSGPAIPAPTASWRLEETGTTARADSVGSLSLNTVAGNEASQGGASIPNVAGILGNACDLTLSFTNSYYLVRNDAADSLRVSGAFTFGGWCKPHTLASSGQVDALAGKFDNRAGGRCWMVGIWDEGGGTVRWAGFLSSDGTAQTNLPDTHFGAITLDTWQFVCLRWDGSSTASLSINAGTPTMVAQSAVFSGSGVNYRIGAWAATLGFSIRSPVDSCMWWQGTALTDAQVTTLYHGGVGYEYYSGAFH